MIITYYEETCKRTIDLNGLVNSCQAIKGNKVVLTEKRFLRRIFNNIVRFYPGNLTEVGDYIFQLNKDAGKMFYSCL